ncbi:MAG: TIGR04076 family protein [Candidatus Omnitrophota bacterium]
MRMQFPKLKVTLLKKEGDCYHGYEVGDSFIFEDFTHPPKTGVCLGIIHSIFPVLYALTFGARFPFMDNPLSLKTTCPDNGKLEFLAEVLDENGKVVVEKKVSVSSGPHPKKMVISVEEVRGRCAFGYKKGDQWEVRGLRTPRDFCGAAYHTMFPVLFALNFGASYPFMENPNSLNTITCPDGGHIRFKVKRVEE